MSDNATDFLSLLLHERVAFWIWKSFYIKIVRGFSNISNFGWSIYKGNSTEMFRKYNSIIKVFLLKVKNQSHVTVF